MNTNILSNSTPLQITLGALFIILITVLITKLIPIFKNKDLSKDDKNAQLQKLIIQTINEAFKISTLKTSDEIKSYCVDKIILELQNQNIQGIDKSVIETSVSFLVDKMLKDKTNK